MQAAALYWHVPSKAALLDEMATTMLRDLIVEANDELAALEGEPWQDCVRLSAVRFRAALLARRDGARVFSGTYLADERLAGWIDLPLSILVGAGFSVPDATRAWGTLLAFVQGFAVEEQAHAGRRGRRRRGALRVRRRRDRARARVPPRRRSSPDGTAPADGCLATCVRSRRPRGGRQV